VHYLFRGVCCEESGVRCTELRRTLGCGRAARVLVKGCVCVDGVYAGKRIVCVCLISGFAVSKMMVLVLKYSRIYSPSYIFSLIQ